MGRKAQWPPPIYPHPNGTDRIRFYLDGKPHERSLGPSGSEESRRRYLEIVAELERDRTRPPAPAAPQSDLTVPDGAARYGAWCDRHHRHADGSPKRQRENIDHAIRPFIRLFHSRTFTELTRNNLRELLHAYLDGRWLTDEERAARLARHRKTTCIPRTANARLGRVRAMIRWLKDERLISADTRDELCGVKGLPAGEAEVPPVDPDDLAKALGQMHRILAAMVRTEALTGARPDEVCRLRPCDFKRSGRIVLERGIAVQLGAVWAVELAEHKTAHKGQRRVILFGPQAQAVLAPFLLGRAPTDYLFSPRDVKALPALTRKGKQAQRRPRGRYDSHSYCRAVARACRRAGVAPFGPNRLRHLAAQNLTDEFDLDVARIVLGHRKLATTMIYAAGRVRAAVEAIEKVG